MSAYDHAVTILESGALLSLRILEDLPTLCTGQTCNLKIDTGKERVWLSRCGVEDGEPYSNKVTLERLGDDGRWVEVETYEARS